MNNTIKIIKNVIMSGPCEYGFCNNIAVSVSSKYEISITSIFREAVYKSGTIHLITDLNIQMGRPTIILVKMYHKEKRQFTEEEKVEQFNLFSERFVKQLRISHPEIEEEKMTPSALSQVFLIADIMTEEYKYHVIHLD